MEKWVLGLILASIPIIAFLLQYYFSKKAKKLKQFKHNFICYYLDFIFIPLGIIFAYSLQFALPFFVPFIFIAVLLNILFHYVFGLSNKKGFEKGYMFKTKSMKINSAGVVHFLFSTLQTFLILEFVFFSLKNVWWYMGLIILVVFFIAAIFDAVRRGWFGVFLK